MQLFNTLTRQLEEFTPLTDKSVRLYSCGPTVYDHIHIGNLSSFVAADTLRRVLCAEGNTVAHVMNFTDIDDKTIKRSRERFHELEPMAGLQKLTREYETIFLKDMVAIGNDTKAISFIRATESIDKMKALITELHANGYAYIADDGVYFSIAKYRASGKTYGQLLELSDSNTSSARIQNDEYDKASVHDFALWKTQKANEPAWAFELDGKKLDGRPGWHIECSAMSSSELGQPFDIHTGGVDLIFPHHENEIAQSTAGKAIATYAAYFFHNEHLLVEGKKMSKSLNNFYTLSDIQKKGFNPLAFRLMVLQSHYRSQSNFTWEILEAAQNRLKVLQVWADSSFQKLTAPAIASNYETDIKQLKKKLTNDINTAAALGILNSMVNKAEEQGFDSAAIAQVLPEIDALFGLGLSTRKDINGAQKDFLRARHKAREQKDWTKSDEIRDSLKSQGIDVRDTEQGQIWTRV